jgi:hypothetical protein
MYYGHISGWGFALLAERFARGEIDESDYQARLATLRAANRDGAVAASYQGQ